MTLDVETSAAPPPLDAIIERKEAQMTTPPASVRPKERPRLSPVALHGLAGEVVRAMLPHTEGDEASLLMQLLALYGNAVGRNAHWRVGRTRHYTNLFVVIVGPSGVGRKGTSLDMVEDLIREAAPDWASRQVSGLSSGEGLIHAVRDPSKETRKDKQTGESYPVDEGERDKRLYVLEPEFSNPLVVMERKGNTLSPVIRQAWDGKPLRILTKNCPEEATGALITIIGHIPQGELRKRLSMTDATNGLGNRILFAWSEQTKKLPQGGDIDPDLRRRFVQCFESAIAHGSYLQEMGMTEDAWDIWGRNGEGRWEGREYDRLTQRRQGLISELCTRAAPQVRRLACIYAAIDHADHVNAEHLRAAIAVWDYCEATVAHVFGAALGNAVADDVLGYLRNEDGWVSRKAIGDRFHRNIPRADMDEALGLLLQMGLIEFKKRQPESGKGRPAEMYRALHEEDE